MRGHPWRRRFAGGSFAALALNQSLGAIGKTVVYTDTVNPVPSEQLADFKSLVGDINAGKVQWLVMLGVNPIYTAPAQTLSSRRRWRRCR